MVCQQESMCYEEGFVYVQKTNLLEKAEHMCQRSDLRVQSKAYQQYLRPGQANEESPTTQMQFLPEIQPQLQQVHTKEPSCQTGQMRRRRLLELQTEAMRMRQRLDAEEAVGQGPEDLEVRLQEAWPQVEQLQEEVHARMPNEKEYDLVQQMLEVHS